MTVALAGAASALLVVPVLAAAEDWPMYMHDTSRSATTTSETAISTANAAQLTKLWSYPTSGLIASSAAIVNDVAYFGSWDGNEYAVNTTTGTLKWKTFLGQTMDATCDPIGQGITSGATVLNGMVYVGGGDSNWYALDATTGAILWSVPTGNNSATGGHYNWSSPLIYNGFAYIGIASNCDMPLVQGQLLQVNLSTHAVTNTFNTVPAGQVGASIWSSPTVDPSTNTVFVTTGNEGQEPPSSQPFSLSIIALDATTLALKSSWQIPQSFGGIDSDWAGTPVLFTDESNRQLVAATNKNGILYAFLRSNLAAGPVWQRQLAYAFVGQEPQNGNGTISSPTFANGTLYAAGGQTALPIPGTPPLLSDNFEGDALGAAPSGWTAAGGTWTVTQGTGSDATHVVSQSNTSGALAELVGGSSTWSNYTIATDLQAPTGTGSFGISARRQDVNNNYQLLLKLGNLWYIGKRVGGAWTTLASGTLPYTAGSWHHFELTLTGSTLSGAIDGTTLATVTDTSLSNGGISLRTSGTPSYDNVVVTADESAPGSVRALDPATGQPLWQHAAPGAVIPALASTNGLIVDGGGSTVEVLDASTGNALFSFQTGGHIFDAASVSDGRIVVGSDDKNEYAFGSPNLVPPPPPPLFSDNFEADALGAAPSGWTAAGGTWTVGHGTGSDTTHVLNQTNTNGALAETTAGSSTWTNYTMAADVQAPSGSGSFGVSARRQDANNNYQLLLKLGNLWYIGKRVGGTWTTLATGNFAYTAGIWYHFVLSLSGSNITASINGSTLASVTDTSFSSGGISLRTSATPAYDNIVVTSP